MFDKLADSLGHIFDKLKKETHLTEESVALTLREIRRVLLEADVALPAVRHVLENVQAKAVGLHLIKDVSPAQQIVKIVYDELLAILSSGETQQESLLTFKAGQASVFMTLGLQGSGKTTSAGKLAKYLKEKHAKKVLVASLDNRRPAAMEQLQILAQKVGVDSLEIMQGQSALEIAQRALLLSHGYDVLILDTAGRMTADTELMQEVLAVKNLVRPQEVLLVADSLTGQDAVKTAEAFHETIGITGIILTRIDGDGRGGAALSMRYVTKQAIKFIGTGEDIAAFDEFHPERITGRILGMGDVVSMVEKAIENFDEADAMSMMQRLAKGIFDYNDLQMQMQTMQKMGGMGGMMNFLPGIRQFKKQIEDANLDETLFKKMNAVIGSMTKQERKNPQLVNSASRKKRIAAGSGVSVAEINKITDMHKKMSKMFTELAKVQQGKGGGMMKRLFNSMTGGMGDIQHPTDMMQMGGDMQNMPSQAELQAMMHKAKMGGGGASSQMSKIARMVGLGKTSKQKPKKIRLR